MAFFGGTAPAPASTGGFSFGGGGATTTAAAPTLFGGGGGGGLFGSSTPGKSCYHPTVSMSVSDMIIQDAAVQKC
jgi:hypothetical protein